MDKVELGPSTHIHLKLSDHIVFKLFDIQNSIQYKACGVKFETRAIIIKKTNQSHQGGYHTNEELPS